MCHGQVIGAALRKARTQKRCSECGGFIDPGETYSRWSWAADGSVSEVRVHLRCHALINEAVSESGEQCLVGGAREYMREGINNTGTWRQLRATLRAGVQRLLVRRGAQERAT